MANSRFEYTKRFEQSDELLPQCWIVVRIDGKGFTKFCQAHAFRKPNDERALQLMDSCAVAVMKEFGDIRIAYGESDEYSFVFHKKCTLYKRRAFKLVSVVVSLFSASYVRLWSTFFPATELQYTPMFDGRAVCYPNEKVLRDYLSWRQVCEALFCVLLLWWPEQPAVSLQLRTCSVQVDTHINNQYNTCYWALRNQAGKTPCEAQAVLKGTLTDFKNEMLFTQFGVNYNELPERFKKGSVIIRRMQLVCGSDSEGTGKHRSAPAVLHVDIIKDEFWQQNPELLA